MKRNTIGARVKSLKDLPDHLMSCKTANEPISDSQKQQACLSLHWNSAL